MDYSKVLRNLEDWLDDNAEQPTLTEESMQQILRHAADIIDTHNQLMSDILSGAATLITKEYQTLVHRLALDQVVNVSKHGMDKYHDTWRNNLTKPKCKERLSKETLMLKAISHAVKAGPDNRKEDESGLPHLAHAIWNLMMLLELYEREEYGEDKQPDSTTAKCG
jgi:hypothetical protein